MSISSDHYIYYAITSLNLMFSQKRQLRIWLSSFIWFLVWPVISSSHWPIQSFYLSLFYHTNQRIFHLQVRFLAQEDFLDPILPLWMAPSICHLKSLQFLCPVGGVGCKWQIDWAGEMQASWFEDQLSVSPLHLLLTCQDASCKLPLLVNTLLLPKLLASKLIKRKHFTFLNRSVLLT